MRKTILLILISIGLVILSCVKDELIPENNLLSKNYLNDFYHSKSYTNLSLAKRFKTTNINYDEIKITYVKNEQDIDVPIINIYIKNSNNKLIGKVEAVSFKDKKGNIDFNILLRNFQDFDLKQQIGNITLTDITEGFTFAKASISKGNIIKRISYNNPKIKFYKTEKHPMDLDGDGNVTWSECYKYANDACVSDPECFSLCYFWGDSVGWVMTGGPLCQGAIASACVVTSWKY